MEDVLSQVEESCPEELSMFVQCVDKNPRTWVHDCDEHKKTLTVCSHTKVPSLVATNKRCAVESDAYSKCLNEHGGQGQGAMVEACKGAMKALHKCTHRHLSGARV